MFTPYRKPTTAEVQESGKAAAPFQVHRIGRENLLLPENVYWRALAERIGLAPVEAARMIGMAARREAEIVFAANQGRVDHGEDLRAIGKVARTLGLRQDPELLAAFCDGAAISSPQPTGTAKLVEVA